MRKSVLFLLASLLSLLISCRQSQFSDDGAEAVDASETMGNAHSSSATDAVSAPDDHSPCQAALFQDSSDIYRICSTRQQRVLPSQGAKNQRTMGKQPFCLRNLYCSSHPQTAWAVAGASGTPLPFVVSRDYYIIALRRILR